MPRTIIDHEMAKRQVAVVEAEEVRLHLPRRALVRCRLPDRIGVHAGELEDFVHTRLEDLIVCLLIDVSQAIGRRVETNVVEGHVADQRILRTPARRHPDGLRINIDAVKVAEADLAHRARPLGMLNFQIRPPVAPQHAVRDHHVAERGLFERTDLRTCDHAVVEGSEEGIANDRLLAGADVDAVRVVAPHAHQFHAVDRHVARVDDVHRQPRRIAEDDSRKRQPGAAIGIDRRRAPHAVHAGNPTGVKMADAWPIGLFTLDARGVENAASLDGHVGHARQNEIAIDYRATIEYDALTALRDDGSGLLLAWAEIPVSRLGFIFPGHVGEDMQLRASRLDHELFGLLDTDGQHAVFHAALVAAERTDPHLLRSLGKLVGEVTRPIDVEGHEARHFRLVQRPLIPRPYPIERHRAHPARFFLHRLPIPRRRQGHPRHQTRCQQSNSHLNPHTLSTFSTLISPSPDRTRRGPSRTANGGTPCRRQPFRPSPRWLRQNRSGHPSVPCRRRRDRSRDCPPP